MQPPAHLSGAENPTQASRRLSCINEERENSEAALGEVSPDTEETEANIASDPEMEGLQLLLHQFAQSQREERRLRTQEFAEERRLRTREFSTMMGVLHPPAGASHSPAAQPLVRNAPNFTKYDGKCDHGAVAQFIHQFVAHFLLAKITDQQDKVHLAAPHLIGEAVPWWQHWSELHTDPLTKLSQYDWDTFVSDFKQRFLPHQFLTDLEDEFAVLMQKGLPIVVYSNKLLTLTQQIGTPEKEKLRAFIRGLDSSIKYPIRNLNPKSYEEALALAQNKELELNGGKPKQATGGSANSQGANKNQAEKGKNGKPKQTPDEKEKAGVLGGFLSRRSGEHIWQSRDVSIATP